MWHRDGWGARARIGILMGHFDIGPEAEFAAMAPDGVTIHSTRVRVGVVMPGAATDAAIRALRALGVRRLALADPPWFSTELNRMGAEYFRSQQIEVVYAGVAAALPSSQHDQHPGRLYEWVRAQVPASAEAVLIGGNGFRAVGAIEALEQDLGRPVLTANSVTFWNALRAAGVLAPVPHYGRIFEEPLPAE